MAKKTEKQLFTDFDNYKKQLNTSDIINYLNDNGFLIKKELLYSKIIDNREEIQEFNLLTIEWLMSPISKSKTILTGIYTFSLDYTFSDENEKIWDVKSIYVFDTALLPTDVNIFLSRSPGGI